MPGDALDEAVTELYSLRPDEFTAARNERAKTVAADDRELGARIRELRRPAPAAWLVNQLVRHRPDEVEAILELGAEARETHGRFDAAELAELGRQRRRLVSALAREAGALADELGSPVRTPVIDEVAQTLQAAMSDAAAADAVRSGRLVRALEAVGVEVDLSDAVAGGPVPSTERDRPPRDADTDGDTDGDTGRPSAAASKRAAAARTRAERAVADAEERVAAASAALESLEARLDESERMHRDLASRRDDLEAELREVEAGISEADRATRSLSRERDRAARDREAADVDAEDARESLESLE
jgi:hypothetical protein